MAYMMMKRKGAGAKSSPCISYCARWSNRPSWAYMLNNVRVTDAVHLGLHEDVHIAGMAMIRWHDRNCPNKWSPFFTSQWNRKGHSGGPLLLCAGDTGESHNTMFLPCQVHKKNETKETWKALGLFLIMNFIHHCVRAFFVRAVPLHSARICIGRWV